jgi:hypothetical protein
MVHFSGCSQNVRAASGDDINLAQQAYYNGHYGFAGVKVQADGICCACT